MNALKKPADQRRRELIKKVTLSQEKFDAGNRRAASQMLVESVLNHLSVNSVPGNDVWVVDASARDQLIAMIQALHQALESLPSARIAWDAPLALAATDAPLEFELRQNYPNPFNPSTTITYALPKEAHVTLKVYDALGEEVVTLVDQDQSQGYYQVRWNARIPSGVYFCRLIAGTHVETRKMILAK